MKRRDFLVLGSLPGLSLLVGLGVKEPPLPPPEKYLDELKDIGKYKAHEWYAVRDTELECCFTEYCYLKVRSRRTQEPCLALEKEISTTYQHHLINEELLGKIGARIVGFSRTLS